MRGGGIFQITGRYNFEKLSKDTGINFIDDPSKITTEADSLIAALWFWNTRNLSRHADSNDILSVSKIINLGSATAKAIPNGLDDRIKQTERFKKLFTVNNKLKS